MAIVYYDNGISRDTNVLDKSNVYVQAVHRGQGCDTVWFESVGQARRAVAAGIKSGHDLFDCGKCACHYSISEAGFEKFPMHACSEAKEKYAAQFLGGE